MKREAYFTQENISTKSRAMLETLAPIRARHDNIHFQMDRAALLVLDMQDYFLDESSHAFIPSASAIVPNIWSLITSFHEAMLPVIFTRHIDDGSGMMPRWWRDTIRIDSPSSAITAFDSSRGTLVQKTQYDAFYNTELESILRGREVEQVVITGVMTHLCCETTARSAFVRGFEVFFCIDGTATYTEEVHLASLLNLSHGFAIPVLCSEMSGQMI